LPYGTGINSHLADVCFAVGGQWQGHCSNLFCCWWSVAGTLFKFVLLLVVIGRDTVQICFVVGGHWQGHCSNLFCCWWSVAGTLFKFVLLLVVIGRDIVQICFDTFYMTFSLLGYLIKSPLFYIVLSVHEHSSGFHLLCLAYKKGQFGGLFDMCY
jgi:hypothetical protein